VLTGQGAAIATTTRRGKLVFGIFAALVELERALISECTGAALASARARRGVSRLEWGHFKPSFSQLRRTSQLSQPRAVNARRQGLRMKRSAAFRQ
jgi:DNA invertase Pin-like site-specific DNA recombinase